MSKNKNYTKGLESLMNSITQNSKITKRYLPHNLKTKENAVKTYLKRPNNIPMAVLGYLTPIEKRAELERGAS